MSHTPIFLLCLFFLFIISKASITSTNDDYYTAAVVEYSPTTNFNPNLTKGEAVSVMMENIKQYGDLVYAARMKGAQIIVFPEYGLYGPDFETRDAIFPFLEEIPNPSNVVICGNKSYSDSLPIVHALSCIALKNSMVVVVNMGDTIPCNGGNNGCPADGRFQFNTDVVFSEDGTILEKYHKSHLYFEPAFDAPANPDPKNFTTSFGVTFGMMICFDIMFPYPQLDYHQANITNMIYSTWWVNIIPYFNANQVQLAWSRDTKSNLLASGIGMTLQSSGSGIYSNGDVMNYFFNPSWSVETALIIATIPKNPQNMPTSYSDSDSDYQLNSNIMSKVNFEDNRLSQTLELKGGLSNISSFVASPGSKGSIEVTVGNLSCSASYQVSNFSTSMDTYALYVLNGDYNNLFYGQICALMLCGNQVCSNYTLEAVTVFESFYLVGNFSSEARLYSSVTTNNMYLAPVASYSTDEKSINGTSFSLPLLAASIFGVVW